MKYIADRLVKKQLKNRPKRKIVDEKTAMEIRLNAAIKRPFDKYKLYKAPMPEHDEFNNGDF